jgi:hypothetical protein
LPPLPAKPQAANRLDLARWLTQPDHPLTARVTVNRLWQQMFGTGLVETSDNFGMQGTPPTHPELLDWLARDFVDHGWDIHHTLKLIALSATYRQDSRPSAEARQKDPYNQLLARFPARRLSAEMLRDQALFVSKLLVEKQGGPSVYPYQPDGLWNEAMGRPNYPRSKGPDLYRRGLYTFWKRTAPPPQMSAFDAPSREACTVRRERTNTPLQALLLLNEPQFVEAARALAERTLHHGGTAAERLAFMFRRVTARRPNDRELAELTAALNDHQAVFKSDAAEAQRLITVGETKPDPALDPRELAAWTMIGNLLLNLDEAINKG